MKTTKTLINLLVVAITFSSCSSGPEELEKSVSLDYLNATMMLPNDWNWEDKAAPDENDHLYGYYDIEDDEGTRMFHTEGISEGTGPENLQQLVDAINSDSKVSLLNQYELENGFGITLEDEKGHQGYVFYLNANSKSLRVYNNTYNDELANFSTELEILKQIKIN